MIIKIILIIVIALFAISFFYKCNTSKESSERVCNYIGVKHVSPIAANIKNFFVDNSNINKDK